MSRKAAQVKPCLTCAGGFRRLDEEGKTLGDYLRTIQSTRHEWKQRDGWRERITVQMLECGHETRSLVL